MSAAKSYEAAAVGIDPAKSLWSFPRCIKCRNAAAASTGDTTVITVGGEVQVKFFGDEGQQFFRQEADIVIAYTVIFEAAVAAS